MYSFLIAFLPVLAFIAFLAFHAPRRVACPDCGEVLPLFCSPLKKTRRMWRAGGCLCARCGCETDLAGRKVTADTPPAPFPALRWAVLAASLLFGAGLAASLMLIGPPTVAAPPMVAPPQQAPAVARVK